MAIKETCIGNVTETMIPEVLLIDGKKFNDERGFFREVLSPKKFKEATGVDFNIVQVNSSSSKKDVIRGLHFQKGEFAQAKLVSCTRGSIIDVAVDIRKDSPTYGKYVMYLLSADNMLQLYIPRGFAHGFKALEDDSVIEYLVDNEYNKESEGGVLYNDPDIGVEWNLLKPIVSDKDKSFPRLKDL